MRALLGNVELSPNIPDDAMEWRNNIHVWTWCRQNHIITQADQQRWLELINKDNTIEMFGIYDRVEGQTVGVCGLTSINRNHGTAEFSLYIAPQHRGKAYGKCGLIRILEYGFYRLRLDTIWGEVMEGNQAMLLFKDVGFTVMETMCRSRYYKRGQRIGSYQIDILRPEFMEKWSIVLGYQKP